ncbi:DUF1501 domain-containing protein [Fontisphaera persica]|uniref:DUF1501 domain-containing protein n=1 Tax=Fontisphaera persica TaxID=2974023 RepID=UPI0024C0ACE0|nr:DUF1501 domain-containing protein [Fontisphaera persica]WCJ58866.1 DUF1501 domain-containing protein [Fontisphaera persica]
MKTMTEPLGCPEYAALVTGQGPRLSRRSMMRVGLMGAATFMLGDFLSFGPLAATPDASKKPKAKSVIQIWLWGGPCHLDTFDPKPEAGAAYAGPLVSPIETNVSGIRICELLPLLAKQADKYTLIRSMTHGNNGHETAAYWVQTGRSPGGTEVYPSMGAVTALFKGYEAGYSGLIPPYIVLTEPQGRFSEAGFLGSKYKPFATGGDPAQARFVVEGVVAQGITDERQRHRRDLLEQIDTLRRLAPGDPQVKSLEAAEKMAYDLILGDAGKVFDLSEEKDELRDRYGRNTFGQSCLVARRLVERGVPYVTINSKGWDTHKEHFQAMRRKLPELDKGLATLLQDLHDRGLLDTTIVWCCGEFGRTPKVDIEAPWNGGRGHYGRVFSALVSGGGFKRGQVLGASSERGEEVKERPVYPADLIGTMYELLGIDLQAKLPHPQGKLARVMPVGEEGLKTAGLLREII